MTLCTLPAHETRGSLSPSLERRLSEAVNEPMRFVDDPAFHLPNARRAMLTRLHGLPEPRDIRYDVIPTTKPASQTPSVKTALTTEQERALFQRLHYARHRAARGKALIERLSPSRRLAWEVIRWTRLSHRLRNRIVRHNLPLVVTIASKIRGITAERTELISEGNLALIRAVEAFDPLRGLKFSTYAWTTVLNSLYKLQTTDHRHNKRFGAALDGACEPAAPEDPRDNHEQACVSEVERILAENRAELTPLESEVIRHRFGMGGGESMTFEQVGQRVGRSCERVRQIQNDALAKIRERLTDSYLDRPQAA